MKVWIMYYADEIGEFYHVFDSEEKLDRHIDNRRDCWCRGRDFGTTEMEVE